MDVFQNTVLVPVLGTEFPKASGRRTGGRTALLEGSPVYVNRRLLAPSWGLQERAQALQQEVGLLVSFLPLRSVHLWASY